ncbi:chalcone isomerase [Powellomyces hirtus]|uniref:Chalcone isomerase n=1 Tax=Powellomyces hirtus TaxID=109895 RepID=A0A507DU03_9FUNG|nr:chalcone isomerase [Powellomyces hirtus]
MQIATSTLHQATSSSLTATNGAGFLLALAVGSVLIGQSIHAEEARIVPVDVLEEPVSKKPVPAKLELSYGSPLRSHSFRLVGLGVRQVTFLNVSVYTIGFYLDADVMNRLRQSSDWKAGYKPEDMEKYVEKLVRGKGDISVRVEPVRNTDGPHLRNGFMRILTKQMGQENLTEDEKTKVLAAMDEFRSAFPTGKVAKGEVFILTKTDDGVLRMEHEGVEKAYIKNRWIAERLMEGYLREQKSIAPKLRKSVGAGLEAVVRGFTA